MSDFTIGQDFPVVEEATEDINPAMERCLKRLIESIDNSNEAMSAFNSFASVE